MNTLVKFIKGGKFEHDAEDVFNKWHLYAKGIADGEFTACGCAVPDYDHKTMAKDRGGITCEICIETIKYFKSIKF